MNLMVTHAGINLIDLVADVRDILSVLQVELHWVLFRSPAQNMVESIIDPIYIVAYRVTKIL